MRAFAVRLVLLVVALSVSLSLVRLPLRSVWLAALHLHVLLRRHALALHVTLTVRCRRLTLHHLLLRLRVNVCASLAMTASAIGG